VSFDPQGPDETLMTIEHVLLSPDIVDQHRMGWSTIATQLDELLRRASTEPS
jgi:hypothetical protein